MDIFQTLVYSDAEAISTDLSQGKVERYLVPILLNQIGLGTQLRITSRGKVMNHLMFQVRVSDFLCRQGNYWVITR